MQVTGTTKGTRSKRQRSVRAWVNADLDNAQIANTPAVLPATIKKLRIVGPTPHASKSTVKKEFGKSTVKKEYGKSTIKKELERFPVVSVQLFLS